MYEDPTKGPEALKQTQSKIALLAQIGMIVNAQEMPIHDKGAITKALTTLHNTIDKDTPIKIKHSENNYAGSLRVWHIPRVAMDAFHVPVATIAQAILVMETLAMYDAFALKNTIKPPYSGLEVCKIENGLVFWEVWQDLDGHQVDEYGINGFGHVVLIED